MYRVPDVHRYCFLIAVVMEIRAYFVASRITVKCAKNQRHSLKFQPRTCCALEGWLLLKARDEINTNVSRGNLTRKANGIARWAADVVDPEYCYRKSLRDRWLNYCLQSSKCVFAILRYYYSIFFGQLWIERCLIFLFLFFNQSSFFIFFLLIFLFLFLVFTSSFWLWSSLLGGVKSMQTALL